MKMNKSLAALAVTTVLGLTAQSQAATVIWDTPVAIYSDSDVSTSGTGQFAFDYSSTGNQTVNSVAFSNAFTQNGVTISVLADNSDPSSYVVGAPATPMTLSSAYQNMLTGAAYKNTGTAMPVTLSGLTVGQDYKVQFWVADYRSYPNNRTETITAGNTSGTLAYLNGGSGTYVIGNFTADGTGSQTFTMLGNESTQINALQLRSVPEPNTAILAGLGGLALFAILRRRRRGA